MVLDIRGCNLEKKRFAKLFESNKYGQILVVNAGDDDGVPTVSFSFVFNNNDALCNFSIKFTEEQGGYASADSFFEKIDIEFVEDLVLGMEEHIDELGS